MTVYKDTADRNVLKDFDSKCCSSEVHVSIETYGMFKCAKCDKECDIKLIKPESDDERD